MLCLSEILVKADDSAEPHFQPVTIMPRHIYSRRALPQPHHAQNTSPSAEHVAYLRFIDARSDARNTKPTSWYSNDFLSLSL